MAYSLRQAYDYWQDQPGSCHERLEVGSNGGTRQARSTDPRPATRASVFRIQLTVDQNDNQTRRRSVEPSASPATIERPFSVRLSSTRCGVEMYKTVECLAQLLKISDSTVPDDVVHCAEALPDRTFAKRALSRPGDGN